MNKVLKVLSSSQKQLIIFAVAFILCACAFQDARCQAEVEPWGNITGIRKGGELHEFESFINVISADGKHFSRTAKERQKPHFRRINDEQIISSNLDSLFFNESVEDVGDGKVKVNLKLEAHKDTSLRGIFFCIIFSKKDYVNSTIHFKGVDDGSKNFGNARQNYDEQARGLEITSADRKFELSFDEPTPVLVRTDTSGGKNDLQLYIAVKEGSIQKGDIIEKNYTLKVSGEPDKSVVNLELNREIHGRPFAGLGGNFRLQNPTTDAQVIDYCLQNMRVAYARVELPWRFWQPDKDVDPVAVADSGKIQPPVLKAMQMAHRLDSMGIPFIMSAWFPPNWAINGKINFRPVNGIWGNTLNKDSINAIYKSIADYILVLKSKYGAEPKLFSFNESDLGINVRLTPQDHDEFIKGCGAYFAAHGLKTKMLLGDNSDATTYKFIYPALNDPEARRYIGAISFHSWRGFDSETLQKWADAASRINVPLLVGEGSIDAAAYSYPDIFQEQTYALKEISLYTRLLAICQPLSILQWQLTADYSPLIGGGIFGNNEALHPGQRFWNLKQLSITPPGLFAMPINSTSENVLCAALGNNADHQYAIHIVNNGARRKAIITGLADNAGTFDLYVTNKEENMKKLDPVEVKNGRVEIKMPAVSYITLISRP